MGKSRFEYQERSDETVSRRIADRGGDYDTYLKGDPMKVKEGENQFRILPASWDAKGPWGDNWAIDIWLHWDVGADKGTYLCLRKMQEIDPNAPKGDCPVCAMLEELDDEETVKRLKAKRSLLAYVIDRNAEKDGPQIWRLGKQLEGNIQFRSKDKKTGRYLPIDHPDRGYDIFFTRVGTDEKTKYINEDVDRSDSPIHDDIKKQDKWLDYITDHPLPDQLNYYTEEHIAKVIKGKSSRKTRDEDDKPSRSSRGRGRSEPEEEPDPRDRRRGRDEDDDRGRERGRGRDEPEEEVDTRRERSRSRDEDDSPSKRRPSRDEEDPGVDNERPRAGRHGSEDEDDSSSRRRPARDEEDDSRERRRPSRDEEPDEDSRERRRPSRDEEEKPSRERERPHRARSDEEDEIPSERDRRRPAPKDADEGEEEPEDEPKGKTTDRAKASLARLKPGGGK